MKGMIVAAMARIALQNSECATDLIDEIQNIVEEIKAFISFDDLVSIGDIDLSEKGLTKLRNELRIDGRDIGSITFDEAMESLSIFVLGNVHFDTNIKVPGPCSIRRVQIQATEVSIQKLVWWSYEEANAKGVNVSVLCDKMKMMEMSGISLWSQNAPKLYIQCTKDMICGPNVAGHFIAAHLLVFGAKSGGSVTIKLGGKLMVKQQDRTGHRLYRTAASFVKNMANPLHYIFEAIRRVGAFEGQVLDQSSSYLCVHVNADHQKTSGSYPRGQVSISLPDAGRNSWRVEPCESGVDIEINEKLKCLVCI